MSLTSNGGAEVGKKKEKQLCKDIRTTVVVSAVSNEWSMCYIGLITVQC